MIVDIHYKLQHFNCGADERLCFMCAVKAASAYSVKDARIKLKSGRKPMVCDSCGNFIHDTIDTGTGKPEEPGNDKPERPPVRW